MNSIEQPNCSTLQIETTEVKQHFTSASICVGAGPSDDDSDTILREEWQKNGVLDRTDGPARTVRSAATGIVLQEQWWRNGGLHRDDGPALIVRNPETGSVTFEQWWKNGQPFPPPSPAAQRPGG